MHIRPRVGSGLVALAVALTALLSLAAPAVATEFNPELIISNDNMRASNSMSRYEIQAFLNTQEGPLKSLVTTDYAGAKRSAADIIWRACQRWGISPKVMLAMLQKEQSLLTRTTLAPRTLERAVGAGCPNATTNRFPGFGRQIWNGARLLDSYGESSTVVPKYYYGIVRRDIYREPTVTLHMRNIATYKLFVYNPSIGASAPYGDLSSQAGQTTGNANFWVIYRRYFGSTFAKPQIRPVYSFRNRYNGTYLYTDSIAERHKLRKPSYARRWVYKGVAFKWDSSVPSTQTVPVYRFKNKLTGKFSFTSSKTLYAQRTSATGLKTWDYQGVAFRASHRRTAGSTPIYRFRNRKTGAKLLTISEATRTRLRSSAYRSTWEYQGAVYFLPKGPASR